ncbi:ribonuclease VapC [Candidatus Bathyarchaeota archaeon]|nr:MAG: ribonuclease VapC [Candidatus Bathyarchaeota archaeon]
MKGEKCAIIDTNAFIYSFLQKVNLFEELKEYGIHSFLVTSKVVKELEELKKEGGKTKIAASVSLDLIKKRCSVIEISNKSADESLLSIAKQQNCVLITNDKRLKKIAKKNGIPTGCITLSKLKIDFFL